MADDADWGPWIEHNGKGFPEHLRGKTLHVLGETHVGKVLDEIGVHTLWHRTEHWNWANFGKCSGRGFAWGRVLRYRIRKDRAVELMKSRAAALDKLRPEVLVDV